MQHTETPFDLLFPDYVVTAESVPHICRDRLYESEWEITANAVPHRQAEFCAGRVCAHEVLKKLGTVDGPVLQNGDRSPMWPENVVGSISHTREYCAAVAALKKDARGIGLDAEPDAPLDWKLAELVCSHQELERLSSLAQQDRCRQAKILFSTKEAAFKCQYPLTGQFIDYNRAVVSLNFDKGSFSVEVMDEAPEISETCSAIQGRFAVHNGLILSGAILTNTAETS